MKREDYDALPPRTQAYACVNALKRLRRPVIIAEVTDDLIKKINKSDLKGL